MPPSPVFAVVEAAKERPLSLLLSRRHCCRRRDERSTNLVASYKPKRRMNPGHCLDTVVPRPRYNPVMPWLQSISLATRNNDHGNYDNPTKVEGTAAGMTFAFCILVLTKSTRHTTNNKTMPAMPPNIAFQANYGDDNDDDNDDNDDNNDNGDDDVNGNDGGNN